MKLPEERTRALPQTPPRISYIAYRGLGWLFVFSIYAAVIAYGWFNVRGFLYKLSRVIKIIAAWEVIALVVYVRWELLIGLSGGLWMLYELLFPWNHPTPDDESKSTELES